MNLSIKTKEAIKTALAMTIAYGIALSMGWDKPYWAGFAVAFISLATVGQSLNKAALRMFGTFVGIAVAFVFIALFAQERWLFMVFLSAWLGICTYMMGGAKHQYFWHVCGFVCVIICMDAGPDALHAFNIAVLRAQETGLGILVYSLVALFLWPSSSGADFNTAAVNLASTQHRLLLTYGNLFSGKGDAAKAHTVSNEEMQAKARFDQLLAAAETDDYEVSELRQQWRQYQRLAADLAETLERWRECFAELHTLDLPRLLPNLQSFVAELDGRLTQIDGMLDNQAPMQKPAIIELALDKSEARSLSHFHMAALAVTGTQLQHVETLTRTLFDCVSGIKGFGDDKAAADGNRSPSAGFVPDPDRVTGAVRLMVTAWLAYLALIYVNDLPGGAGFVTMACAIGMILATTPQLPVSKLFVPVTVGVLIGSVAYIFVMPQLSSFFGLGLLIFAVTFTICYLFAAPQQALGRAFGLAMFVTIAAVSNEQSYNFLSVANTALMFPLLFLLLAITAHIPVSPRPEQAFLRLLSRFFRSSEYLISTMQWDPKHAPTRVDRWRKEFHAREVATLPRKLAAWGKFIDPKALPGTSPEQEPKLVQALVTSLQALTYRMQQLLEERDNPQAQLLVQQLLEDFRAWRLGIQKTFMGLSMDPAAGKQAAFRDKLDEMLQRLEAHIQDAIDKAPEKDYSDQDAENFYRLLGAYRGVSEGLVDYATNAGVIDWAPWHEERFA